MLARTSDLGEEARKRLASVIELVGDYLTVLLFARATQGKLPHLPTGRQTTARKRPALIYMLA